MFVFLSKLSASLMRVYFPKRQSGAQLLTLSKLYDVPVGFVTPLLHVWECVLIYLRSPKGGCCSISDDLSCSYGTFNIMHINYSVLVKKEEIIIPAQFYEHVQHGCNVYKQSTFWVTLAKWIMLTFKSKTWPRAKLLFNILIESYLLVSGFIRQTQRY